MNLPILLFCLCLVSKECFGSGDYNKVNVQLPTVVPLVVIGSGPAGHAAAQYGTHLGIPTILIQGPVPGGLLTQTSSIDNYPGVPLIPGEDLMETMRKQTKDRGAEILEDTVISIDLSERPFRIALKGGMIMSTLSLIIATGAIPKKLGIPGEQTYWGKGVSSCALCDGYFFKGKDVVVVGGGDSAIEEALQLSAHAKSVTIFVRKGTMRAASPMQDRLKNFPNIQPIAYNKRVLKVLGTKTGVTGLEVQDLLSSKKSIFPTQGLFLAIGHTPSSELVNKQLELSDSGHIRVNPRTQETSVEGVFAAGDVEDADYRQAIVAAGRGCVAAIKAVEWLRNIGYSKSSFDQFLTTMTSQK